MSKMYPDHDLVVEANFSLVRSSFLPMFSPLWEVSSQTQDGVVLRPLLLVPPLEPLRIF